MPRSIPTPRRTEQEELQCKLERGRRWRCLTTCRRRGTYAPVIGTESYALPHWPPRRARDHGELQLRRGRPAGSPPPARAAATPPRRPPSGGPGTVCPPPPSRCTRRKGSQWQREKRRRGAKAPPRPVIWRGGDPSSLEKKPKADAEMEMNGRRGGSIWRRMKRCRMRWWRWAGDRWRGHGGGAAPAQPPWRVSCQATAYELLRCVLTATVSGGGWIWVCCAHAETRRRLSKRNGDICWYNNMVDEMNVSSWFAIRR